jgi:precorrin isomerase
MLHLSDTHCDQGIVQTTLSRRLYERMNKILSAIKTQRTQEIAKCGLYKMQIPKISALFYDWE